MPTVGLEAHWRLEQTHVAARAPATAPAAAAYAVLCIWWWLVAELPSWA